MRKGLEIEFISADLLRGGDVIGMILEKVRENKILVLEESLSPEEEVRLIEATMGSIDENFSGIEISTLGSFKRGLKERLIRLLGGRLGITVIGPSKLIKEIKRDPTKILVLARA